MLRAFQAAIPVPNFLMASAVILFRQWKGIKALRPFAAWVRETLDNDGSCDRASNVDLYIEGHRGSQVTVTGITSFQQQFTLAHVIDPDRFNRCRQCGSK
jgi:hypothetical protein